MSNGVQNQGEIAMQTDKYTKVVLTLIAVGIFSLGCGGGASLEEVNELRQEIAALRDSVNREFGKIELKSVMAPLKVSDMVRTKYLEIVNEDGETVIYAGTEVGDGDGVFEV